MLISFWKDSRNLFIRGLVVVSLRLMSGKNEGFFNLLVGMLRSERGTEKAPRCLVTSGRKFTKEAQGRTVWIQHEQLTSQEGKTLFVALFYFGVGFFGFFFSPDRSLWANLCNGACWAEQGSRKPCSLCSAWCAAGCPPPSRSQSPGLLGKGC